MTTAQPPAPSERSARAAQRGCPPQLRCGLVDACEAPVIVLALACLVMQPEAACRCALVAVPTIAGARVTYATLLKPQSQLIALKTVCLRHTVCVSIAVVARGWLVGEVSIAG